MGSFRRCVGRYGGGHRIKSSRCLDQYLCMAFAQRSKLYHMGIRGRVSRSTLADANEQRDWRIHADFARLYHVTQCAALFVVRGRANFKFHRIHSHPSDRQAGLIRDQTVVVSGLNSAVAYPDTPRRIKVRDRETAKTYVFLTNNFPLPATPLPFPSPVISRPTCDRLSPINSRKFHTTRGGCR